MNKKSEVRSQNAEVDEEVYPVDLRVLCVKGFDAPSAF
jgi:hypothetical protein